MSHADELRFDGRVAIVTGSGTGLGRSHALLLASRGAAVVVNDLVSTVGPDAAADVVGEIDQAGGTALAHRADVSEVDEANGLVAAALDHFGRVDIVVNNAGSLRACDFGDMTSELFDRVVAVNLRATFLVAHAAWAPMTAQRYGRIISTTSNSGLLGTAGSTAYAAAKAGVWGLTRSLALEGAPVGINVNAIAPIAFTAMSATSRIAPRSWRSGEGDAWSRRLDVAQVSPAVAWLAHEHCTLNGQVWSVAGGRVARFVMGPQHRLRHRSADHRARPRPRVRSARRRTHGLLRTGRRRRALAPCPSHRQGPNLTLLSSNVPQHSPMRQSPREEGHMQFMFQYPDVHGLDADMLDAGPVVELAQTAEKAGWNGISFTEHPAPGTKWLASGGHQTLDPFVALGAVAAVTTRLRLLTYLAVVPYRNPMLLAKAAATVDKLSGGRFILGTGTGYLKAEFHALGIDFDERNELFDEALDVLPLHWSGDSFSYAGKHFNARDIIARPRPVQQPIPIWIGGNAKITLQRIAERAQGWMPLTGPAEMAATTRSPHLESIDSISSRLAILRELAGDRFDSLDLAISYTDPTIHQPTVDVQRHREALAAYRELGATWIVVSGPTGEHPIARDFVEAFAEEYITA